MLALGMLLVLVAGIPWGLVRFVGWPLPDHLPTWGEVEAVLLSPMSAQFLLNILATLCWIVWLVFVLDLLRCLVDVARGNAPGRSRSLLRRISAALVGTMIVALLGNRAADAATVAVSGFAGTAPMTVSAPKTPGPSAHGAQQDGTIRVSEQVRAPRGGHRDSLWRIAERVYGPGNGHRWQELYHLNHGIEQADGRRLTNPHTIHPGWTITAHVPAPPPRDDRPPTVPPGQRSSPSTAPPHTSSGEDRHRDRTTASGLELPTGAFVSVALATGVTLAVASARMWRRRRYCIGSGDRADLQRPSAPVVRALRAAYADHAPGRLDTIASHTLEPDDQQQRVLARLGVHDERALAMDLASTSGLGLTGPGALAAARALLLHMLAEQPPCGLRVIMPELDQQHVLGTVDAADLPSAVRVVASLDDALAEIEAALITRTRQAAEQNTAESHPASLVLLASPTPRAQRRLQALLANGARFGIAGVLLGGWLPEATVVVQGDGTTSTSGTGLVSGARLFHLPAADAVALLSVLREAEGPSEHGQSANASSSVQDRDIELIPAEPLDPPAPAPYDGNRPAPQKPLRVRILGRIQLTFLCGEEERELAGVLTPKHAEVLAYLALHPHGVRRDVLNEAVWPHARPPRPYNSFHNTMSVLRRAIDHATAGAVTSVVRNEDGRYRLDDTVVSVDLWQLQAAMKGARTGTPDTLMRLGEAQQCYRGDVAEDVLAPWVDPYRESVRRDVLDALDILVRAQADTDPEGTLVWLERARVLDPYNDGIYRDIVRTQARLGQQSAIPRTLALLTRALDDIGQTPSADTLNFVAALQRGTTRDDVAAITNTIMSRALHGPGAR
ncbi:BTAD domain-containing putative transcriptional regulator [Allokutzneria sp. NRRL B-24872]|uniref:BTAD domain-containing putative transcriptional regulator n=1 Tax=Allokutzneria sp. NRRL B-24872 TaxID=1137961 RepID=UPI00143D45B5|nr:BTAD domain-containing putative transcriptional regulator [Allokutzneria sp. NRRL B-24872]